MAIDKNYKPPRMTRDYWIGLASSIITGTAICLGSYFLFHKKEQAKQTSGLEQRINTAEPPKYSPIPEQK